MKKNNAILFAATEPDFKCVGQIVGLTKKHLKFNCVVENVNQIPPSHIDIFTTNDDIYIKNLRVIVISDREIKNSDLGDTEQVRQLKLKHIASGQVVQEGQRIICQTIPT